MDWLQFAKSDWYSYHDKTRIAKYVEFAKITVEEYEEIVGESYEI
jgi:hypothetical protein